ncbi:hypothetical protein MRX96_055160 [Rhipicephalus microplus]
MCRILRSEAWRQVRFYTDCLQFLNRNELPYPSAQKKFIEDLRLASQTADFLWGNILVQLPRSKRRNYVPGQDVLVLGEASIPNNVADLLRLGPKYCEHPDLDKTELLSLVRTAAGKASMDESDRARLYAYSLKHSYLPPEVALLFGAMRPSEGHAKRMCRILRSEAWRQVRFYTDCLQFLNRNELPYPSAQKKFIEDLRLASQTADFLWGNILVQLPRSKRRNYVPGQDVLVLGEASIPNNVADLLRLGPKYCEHPDLDKTELLSLEVLCTLVARNSCAGLRSVQRSSCHKASQFGSSCRSTVRQIPGTKAPQGIDEFYFV